MTQKLKLTPNISYMLGMYSHSIQERSSVAAASRSEDAIEKFIGIALKDLQIEPDRILISTSGYTKRALFYNSKLRKLFDNALKRRTAIFKYANEYSAQYVAGTFDAKGGVNARGIYISDMDDIDSLVMQTIGLYTKQQGALHYINNERLFIAFIEKYSAVVPHIARKPTL